MTLPRLWPDRLGSQIALLLLGALLLEFVGSEWLLSRTETGMIARERAGQVAQQIDLANRLMDDTPPAERQAMAERLWRGPLTIAWQADPAGRVGNPALKDEARLAPFLRTRALELTGGTLRLSSDGAALLGGWRLRDGTWMSFRAEGYLAMPVSFRTHIVPVMLLVACVALLALILARLIGGPLRRLADAADRVGREESIIISEEGPREVRRLAAAFNAMQARLLEQVDERIKALAAVSHDLRTPIARARLRTGDIAETGLRDAIAHDLDEMESFIRSLLAYLRGGDPEAERLIDLASLVITIVDDARDMGGDVHYDGPPTLEMTTRPIKLQRVIANLVQNALRHGGSAQVRLVQGEDAVLLTVEDDGPGIPEDRLEAVFEPFRRLEASRNRGTGGAGLGLAIVKRSIGRLGGTISLTNRPEGGLRAAISVPLQRHS